MDYQSKRLFRFTNMLLMSNELIMGLESFVALIFTIFNFYFYDLSYLLSNYRSAFLNVSISTYYSDLNGNRNLINGFRMLLSIEVKENAHI